jgi:DUF2934 family protein
MAKSKSPNDSKAGKKNSTPTDNAFSAPGAEATVAGTTTAEAIKADGRKLEVVRNDSRANVVPINLEDEIRRRAYELYERRGFEAGHEKEDWLLAESEVLARYQQQSA